MTVFNSFSADYTKVTLASVSCASRLADSILKSGAKTRHVKTRSIRSGRWASFFTMNEWSDVVLVRYFIKLRASRPHDEVWQVTTFRYETPEWCSTWFHDVVGTGGPVLAHHLRAEMWDVTLRSLIQIRPCFYYIRYYFVHPSEENASGK